MHHKKKLHHLGIGALLATSLGFSSLSGANDRRVPTERFTEFAPVVNVEPIYRQVRINQPRRECWTEEQRQLVGYETINRVEHHNNHRTNRSHSTSNALIGGVIGGVIGNQLGRNQSHRSRTTATVAGAIIGGAIGNETSRTTNRHRRYNNQPTLVDSTPIYETQTVERCKRTVNSTTERQLQYYNVTYRYKGRTFTTQLPRDPGNQIELQVSVAPARQ